MPRNLTQIVYWLLPAWRQDRTPDPRHPHRRRFTRGYRRKQGLVKNIWICSGCAMLFNPALGFVLPLALTTTLFSFLILDETR